MNQYQQREDIEKVIEDGINAVIREMVRADQVASAKTLVFRTGALKNEIRIRLQTAFAIRRPRKR